MNQGKGPRALAARFGGIILLAGTAAALQEGAGLAQGYPGDEGIERDPRVVFVERFDEDLETLFDRYDDVAAPGRMQLDGDTPPGPATETSLLMTHVGGAEDSIHLFTRLTGYEEGYDILIVATALVERLELLSNEGRQNNLPKNPAKKKIPAVCGMNGVACLDFITLIVRSGEVFER